MLVIFEAVEHKLGRIEHPHEKLFAVLALIVFAVTVLAEFVAYPYGQRNDELSNQQDQLQQNKIASLLLNTQKLANSTQGLKADAQKEHARADGFEAKIAYSNAKARSAEATVALANAASKDAVAKVATANARIAEAEQQSRSLELKTLEASKQLEDERRRRVELAVSFAPRRFEDQSGALIGLKRLHAMSAFVEFLRMPVNS